MGKQRKDEEKQTLCQRMTIEWLKIRLDTLKQVR